uniref:Bola-like protein n=1 Tax=Candidozyma auris TaxID=498019 RepID=A0A0L0P3L1_CANAR
MLRFLPKFSAQRLSRSVLPPLRLAQSPSLYSARPFLTIEPMGSYEQKIYDILKAHFEPSNLQVRDISGGCGSMFAITVESSQFKGIPMIKQHRLVNEVLKEEIAQWHGLQLKTKAA